MQCLGPRKRRLLVDYQVYYPIKLHHYIIAFLLTESNIYHTSFTFICFWPMLLLNPLRYYLIMIIITMDVCQPFPIKMKMLYVKRCNKYILYFSYINSLSSLHKINSLTFIQLIEKYFQGLTGCLIFYHNPHETF